MSFSFLRVPRVLLACLLAVAACSSIEPTVDDPQTNDGGHSIDAGDPGDAGHHTDGGHSTDGGHHSDGGTHGDGEEVGTAIFRAMCDSVIRCQDFPVSDPDLCLMVLDGPVPGVIEGTRAIKKAIDDGQILIDQSQLAACEDELRALECGHVFDWDFQKLPGCAAALQGQVADYDACLTTLSCAPNSHCFPTSETDACEALCLPLGMFCLKDSDCTDGTYCNYGLCDTPPSPLPGNGEDCASFPHCQSGLVCLGYQNGGGFEGICEPLSTTVGGACSFELGCGSDLVCDQATFTCVAPGTGASEGGSCEIDGTIRCNQGLICVYEQEDGAHCRQPKAKGEACSRTFECGGQLSSLVCDPSTHVCVDRPSSGPCPVVTTFDTCLMTVSYCDRSTETCQPTKKEGEACTKSEECRSSGTVCLMDDSDGKSYCRLDPSSGLNCVQ